MAIDLRAVAGSRCMTMSVEIGIEVGIQHVDARKCDMVRLTFGLYTYCGDKGRRPEGEIGGG